MMKRRLLCIGLVASLVLSVLMPGTALADKGGGFEEFTYSGTITAIEPGDVREAGGSGRWIVAEREVSITSEDGVLYTMTYAANVPIATQAGSFHGTLDMGSVVFKVRGKSQPIHYAYDVPSGLLLPYPPTLPVYRLGFSGSWTITDGTQGNGTFSGWAEFVPTPEGHVGWIVASFFEMTGKWKQ